jgi:hypothetical protein
MKKDNKGKRYNSGKLRWDLVPLLPINEIIRVFTVGADKYEDWNWYRGMKYSVSYASGQRHRSQWWLGEDIDKESGVHHLAHSIVNDMFNLTYELEERKNLDDRLKVFKK